MGYKLCKTEERRCIGGDIKCVAGSYSNGFYDAEKDEFRCLACSLKKKELKQYGKGVEYGIQRI